MCGRSTLTVTEEELETRFGATFYSEDLERYNPLPNFNIAPTQMMPVITDENPDRISVFRWGLIPSWAKDEKIGGQLINARCETASDKPAFRKSLYNRRCLWPIDGYYEWEKRGKSRFPYRVVLPDRSVFTVAGLWEKWYNDSGEVIFSFSVLTRDADPSMEFLHHRIPCILSKNLEKEWLDPDTDPVAFLEELSSLTSEELHIYRVSEKMNNVRFNSPDLILEVPDITQPSLF